MIDHRGKVQIPGFYDDVVPLTDRERREMAALPFDEAAVFRRGRRLGGDGRRRLHLARARWARPTFDICGLTERLPGRGGEDHLAGHGDGQVQLPAGPASGPGEDQRVLRQWVAGLCPPGITWEMSDFHGSRASWFRWTAPTWRRRPAIQHAFGRPPVYTREGGSIPSWAPSMTALGRTRSCWVGGRTTTTRTVPTRNSAWPISIAPSRPAPRLWEEVAKIKGSKARGSAELTAGSLRHRIVVCERTFSGGRAMTMLITIPGWKNS